MLKKPIENNQITNKCEVYLNTCQNYKNINSI